MRTVAVVLTMCLLVSLAGCFESNTASVYGNPESDGVMGLRLGTEVANNLEIGAVAQYAQGEVTTTTSRKNRGGKDDNRRRGRKTTTHEHEDDWNYGVFAHYSVIEGDISPYVGAQATIGNGSNDIVKTIQPVAGVTLWDFLFVEWQDKSLNGEDDKIMGGIEFKF